MGYDVPVSSGEKSTDTQIAPSGKNGLVTYFEVKGNGGAGAARIYSGTSAVAGNKLADLVVASGAVQGIAFPKGVAYHGGLFLAVDATTIAVVHYL